MWNMRAQNLNFCSICITHLVNKRLLQLTAPLLLWIHYMTVPILISENLPLSSENTYWETKTRYLVHLPPVLQNLERFGCQGLQGSYPWHRKIVLASRNYGNRRLIHLIRKYLFLN
jgi:hypothetical protein